MALGVPHDHLNYRVGGNYYQLDYSNFLFRRKGADGLPDGKRITTNWQCEILTFYA
jgi:hypothetical protein